jgi:hypothetical protein
MANSETFEDSVEATEFIDKIFEALKNPKLEQWVRATDDNFSADVFQKFVRLKFAFIDFVDEMDKAC